jgi:hypothetical protein
MMRHWSQTANSALLPCVSLYTCSRMPAPAPARGTTQAAVFGSPDGRPTWMACCARKAWTFPRNGPVYGSACTSGSSASVGGLQNILAFVLPQCQWCHQLCCILLCGCLGEFRNMHHIVMRPWAAGKLRMLVVSTKKAMCMKFARRNGRSAVSTRCNADRVHCVMMSQQGLPSRLRCA